MMDKQTVLDLRKDYLAALETFLLENGWESYDYGDFWRKEGREFFTDEEAFWNEEGIK